MATKVNVRDALQEIVDGLVQGYSPDKIILFGSHAYGRPDRDSDIDLLIIKDTATPRLDRQQEARDCLDNPAVRYPPMDILVYTPSEIDDRLAIGDHFIEDILDQGQVLYSRSGKIRPLALRETGPAYRSVPPYIRYAQEWYKLAEHDLTRVTQMLSLGDAEDAGFHLQQALEKFLKAFLIAKGWRLQRTHDVESLLIEAAQYDPQFESYQSLCKQVRDYNIETRYPSFPARPTLTEAEVQASLAAAQELIQKLRL